MGDIKTPRNAKGSRSLKILKKTSQSVYSGKLPPRSSANFKHSHSLTGARQIKRIDRQDWEERIADIHAVLEEHRHGRANRMYSTLDAANEALAQARRKEEELLTFTEELNASNEEMRAANEEMRANAEEMRATNEELRVISEEMERVHRDQESLVPLFLEAGVNPLVELGSGLSSLLEGDKQQLEGLDPQLVESLSAGSQAIKKLTGILSATGDYWLIDQRVRSFEHVDCDDLISEAKVVLEREMEVVKGHIQCSLLPELYIDKESLLELFVHLLRNGLQFGTDTPPMIHVSSVRCGDWKKDMPEPRMEQGWVFSIMDNGCGVDPEKLQEIFSIFETLDSPKGGAGMGLAKAWRLVRHLSGHIWAESEPGKGTTVHFTIPDYEEGHTLE